MRIPREFPCRPSRRSRAIGFAVIALGGAFAFGQFYGGSYFRVPEEVRTQREVPTRSVYAPVWDNPRPFEGDVFTFTRLRYGRNGWRGGVGGGSWMTDLPDADLNLSWRLQQMTSMKVDSQGRILRASSPDLRNYPFLMAAAPGALELAEDEILALRNFLLNGGFFLLTDFWGDREWNHFEKVMKQILPQHQFVELSLEHPIYQCLFPIRKKNQVPRVDIGNAHLETGSPTWERGPDGKEVHHRAIFDEKGRFMVLALHNSDDSDGWEWEGDNAAYFHTYAEGMAYPLALNIIFYVMTH